MEEWFERENKVGGEGQNRREKSPFSCAEGSSGSAEPPSRDVSVISSVRWTVPGEAITLNRFTAATVWSSYRC